MNPYVGITDFMNFEQVKAMLAVFNQHKKIDSDRKLHVGVMMSFKTLHNLPTKWADAFPRKEEIRRIFSSDETYNCLHFVDYENRPDLWRTLVQAISFGGMRLDAVQLDMVWPEPSHISHGVHTSRKPVEIILQIGQKAFDAVDNNETFLINKLAEYEGVIDRVLLDRSMGKGIPLQPELLLPFARKIKWHFPEIGIGFAGGIGPTTVSLIEPLVKEFPDLSIDAQGKLRASGNALDPIDWPLAEDYLIEALKILS
ncbi:MAG: hypothetical protein WCT18_04550 [Patescibacteria group bacterium]